MFGRRPRSQEASFEDTVVPPPGGRLVSTATDGASMAPEVRRLIDRGLDLVPGIVAAMTTHFPRHVERAELVRAGSLGVVEAAWRFDPSRGVPFERFVTRRVRGAVLDALRAFGTQDHPRQRNQRQQSQHDNGERCR